MKHNRSVQQGFKEMGIHAGGNRSRFPPEVTSSQKLGEEGQHDGFIFRGRKAFPPGRGWEVPEALFVFCTSTAT